MAHMREDAISRGLVGGGLRSRSPSLLQMWLIQWAPGGCLAGWLSAALVQISDAEAGTTLIVVGMMFGVTAWALIALSSWPLFAAIRPWIDRLACKITRRRGAALAAAGVTPFVLISIAVSLTLIRHETSVRVTSADGWVLVLVLSVVLGLGTFAAAEMWHVVLRRPEDTPCSQFNEPVDITPAVRVKEDLEVLRIVLSGATMLLTGLGILLVALLITPLVLLLTFQVVESAQPVQLVQFVPFALLAFAIVPLIALSSYQIGLWYFVSVRTFGVLLFVGALWLLAVFAAEPLRELYVGSQIGYSWTAWVYSGLLAALTVPGLVVTGSVLRMSLRLMRLKPELEPVAHGWRAWPTHLWAHALRTLCLPSFLVALPERRTRPILLFALAAGVSALSITWFGLITQAPIILTFMVRAGLSEKSDAAAGSLPTIGAAITAVSPTQLSGLVPQNFAFAVPFVLILILGFVAIWPFQKVPAWLLRRAQRRAAIGYQTVIQRDTRDLVLFLRPFRGDMRFFEAPATCLIAKLLRTKHRRRTLDEIVLDAASPIGPVIALGAPDQETTPLGAARLFASDTEWQDSVRGLAHRSRVVIVYFDEGEGTLWELEHLLESGHLSKTLCILNPRTSLATIMRAIEQSRRAGNAAMCGLLEEIRNEMAGVPTGKELVGVRFADGVVMPIIAEDASDYTQWCMVNLMLVAMG